METHVSPIPPRMLKSIQHVESGVLENVNSMYTPSEVRLVCEGEG